MNYDYFQLWWIAGCSYRTSLRGVMVEEFRFYYGTNFPVPLCAYESKAPPKSSKAKFKTKGVTWRPGEFHIPHSPRASPPVSISIQRFIVKVNFWLILLFFFKKVPYAHSATTAFPLRGELQCIVGAGYCNPLAWRQKGSGQVRYSGRQLPAE